MTKSHVFTEIFVAVFPLETPFWPAQLMFCIYGFQNKNRAAQNDGFIGVCVEVRQHGNEYYYTVIFLLLLYILTVFKA